MIVPPDEAIRCWECHPAVDEFTAIAQKWGYWSDGVGELVSPTLHSTRSTLTSAIVVLC